VLDYLLQRLAISAITLVVISVIVFTGVRMIPGDPARVMGGTDADEAGLADIREKYGLNDPVPIQYLRWVGLALRGDLGESIRTRESVVSTVAKKLPITLELACLSILVALAISIPVGVLSAARRNTAWDYRANGISLCGLSVPSFWLGIMLILLLSVRLHWLPASGFVPLWQDPVANLTRMIMPAFAGFANKDSEYVNDTSADRSYTSYEVELNRRYGNNWQFRSSYSATKKTEPFGTSDNTVIVGLDPNSEVNAAYNGLLEWEYRAAASYLFRYGILTSANFDIRSGEYWERSVQFRGPAGSRIPTQVLRVEPRGSRQADALTMLDIRAEKRFELGGSKRLSVTLNVYNLLNSNAPLGIQGRSGPTFGFVTSIPPGRLVEGAFRIGF